MANNYKFDFVNSAHLKLYTVSSLTPTLCRIKPFPFDIKEAQHCHSMDVLNCNMSGAMHMYIYDRHLAELGLSRRQM